jgi:hypothetical protein
MKFMVTWDVHPDKRTEVQKAWVALGRKERANVGKGVKLIGRWHNSAELNGVTNVQTVLGKFTNPARTGSDARPPWA